MTAPVRPANAGAITRSLVAAGFRRGEEHKASRGMVRGGWSTFTEGITSEQVVTRRYRQERYGPLRNGVQRVRTVAISSPTGYVNVAYQFSRSGDRLTTEERNTKALDVLTRAADHLRTKGFEVEVKTDHGSHAAPYLSVCRRDADGKVVRF